MSHLPHALHVTAYVYYYAQNCSSYYSEPFLLQKFLYKFSGFAARRHHMHFFDEKKGKYRFSVLHNFKSIFKPAHLEHIWLTVKFPGITVENSI